MSTQNVCSPRNQLGIEIPTQVQHNSMRGPCQGWQSYSMRKAVKEWPPSLATWMESRAFVIIFRPLIRHLFIHSTNMGLWLPPNKTSCWLIWSKSTASLNAQKICCPCRGQWYDRIQNGVGFSLCPMQRLWSSGSELAPWLWNPSFHRRPKGIHHCPQSWSIYPLSRHQQYTKRRLDWEMVDEIGWRAVWWIW